MRRLVSLLLTSLVFSLAVAAQTVKVEVRTDRADALYACSDQASMRVSVTEDGNPVTAGTVAVVVTRDGGERLGQRVLDLAAEGGAVFTVGLEQPGFARVEATFAKDDKEYRGLGAAAFEPEKIPATTVNPEDFDSFWRTAQAQLAEIPLDVQLTRLDQIGRASCRERV